MSGDRNRKDDAAAGAQVLDAGNGRLHGGTIARDDDLAGGVAVRHSDAAERRAESQQFGNAGVVEADDRCHGAGTALPGCLHLPAALADQPHGVAE